MTISVKFYLQFSSMNMTKAEAVPPEPGSEQIF